MRALSNLDRLRAFSAVFWMKDTATTGTTAQAETKGATSITLGAGEGSGFADGDEFRLGPLGGTGFQAVIDTVSTDTLNLVGTLPRAVAAGETVTKLSAVNLGATTTDGINYQPNQSIEDIEAGTQLDIYDSEPGVLTRETTFSLFGFNEENLAVFFGIDEEDTTIVSADAIVLNPDDFLSRGVIPWKSEHIRKDGVGVTHYWMAEVAAVNGGLQFAYRAETAIPITQRLTGIESYVFA